MWTDASNTWRTPRLTFQQISYPQKENTKPKGLCAKQHAAASPAQRARIHSFSPLLGPMFCCRCCLSWLGCCIKWPLLEESVIKCSGQNQPKGLVDQLGEVGWVPTLLSSLNHIFFHLCLIFFSLVGEGRGIGEVSFSLCMKISCRFLGGSVSEFALSLEVGEGTLCSFNSNLISVWTASRI